MVNARPAKEVIPSGCRISVSWCFATDNNDRAIVRLNADAR